MMLNYTSETSATFSQNFHCKLADDCMNKF